MTGLLSTQGTQVITSVGASRVDTIVSLWLSEKSGRSASRATVSAYTRTITALRATLAQRGLDLDSDPRAVRIAVSVWARSGGVAAATINQRIAIVSSYYDYVLRHELGTVNPTVGVERARVHAYAGADVPDTDTLAAALSQIDTTSPVGMRDYLIISVALVTGRRLSEIASLRYGHVHVTRNGRVTLVFDRVKGGSSMRDTLDTATGSMLIRWLASVYGDTASPDAAVWPSLRATRTTQVGGALSARTLERVCVARVGSHFHSLRHAYAHAMEGAGATVSEIQRRLGHATIATTGRYLAALRRDENPLAAVLAGAFGIGR